MILCIDIGNSNLKFGIYQDDSLIHHWRISSKVDRSETEYELLVGQFLAAASIQVEQIGMVAISCVIPRLVEPFQYCLRQLFASEPLWIRAETDLGLEIRIDNPREIGSDLLANAVAGYAMATKPCIVVDFGTALSFTAVNRIGGPSQAAFIAGVAIAPGIGSALRALNLSTAQLPEVPLAAPPQAIGANTINSIQSGLIFGYTGLVEGLIRRMAQELHETPIVIGTGWMSDIIAAQSTVFTYIEPWLTLNGLRLIAARNTGALKT